MCAHTLFFDCSFDMNQNLSSSYTWSKNCSFEGVKELVLILNLNTLSTFVIYFVSSQNKKKCSKYDKSFVLKYVGNEICTIFSPESTAHKTSE